MIFVFRRLEEAKKKERSLKNNVGDCSVSGHVEIVTNTRKEAHDDSHCNCDTQEAEPLVGEFIYA